MSYSTSCSETIAISTASTTNTIVDISARVADKLASNATLVKERLKIYVFSYQLVSAGAVTAQFLSASTPMTGAMSLITGTPVGMCAGGCELQDALIVCAANEDLMLTLSTTTQVSGHINYMIA